MTEPDLLRRILTRVESGAAGRHSVEDLIAKLTEHDMTCPICSGNEGECWERKELVQTAHGVIEENLR